MVANGKTKKAVSTSDRVQRSRKVEVNGIQFDTKSSKLLILGMHRSGTSMVGALVSKFGVNQLGNRPMSAAADNPNGFFEDIGITQFNDELLESMESAWDAPICEMDRSKDHVQEEMILSMRKTMFSLSMDCGSPWFIKDPRMCLLLKPWERILMGAAPAILVVRDPQICSIENNRFIAIQNQVATQHLMKRN